MFTLVVIKSLPITDGVMRHTNMPLCSSRVFESWLDHHHPEIHDRTRDGTGFADTQVI